MAEKNLLAERPWMASIEPKHFGHPLDVSARRRIDRIIASRSWIKRIFDGAERKAENHFYTEHLADDTRLSRRQAASVFRHVEEVSELAGMDTPRVFLNTHHEVNASALGQHKPILLLHSALIDQFTEAQLRAVIAHELGHVKCQHTFYKVVAHKFAPIAAIAASVPGGSLVAMALQWHMNDWSRKAELSADRFGLLVTDDLDTVQTMLIQLAGGSSIVADELSADEFRQQADEYRAVSRHGQKPKTTLEKIEYYATELILNPDLKTHPWPAIRFVELEQWAQSRQYADLRAGNLAEAERHPFQYLPDTVADDELDTEAVDGPFAAPVLRQAAEEVAGKFKNWSAKLSASTGGSPPADAVPQGWYTDPQHAEQLRWWDGANWGSETRPQ